MERNKFIEGVRFLFAFIILMVHTNGLRPEDSANYPFAGGYVIVEGFLILSGFFAANYVRSDMSGRLPAQLALAYVGKQYIKILPTVVICVVMQYLVALGCGTIDFQDFPYLIYEAMLLPQTGIYKIFLDLPLWYLSAYFVCLPLFIYCLKRSSDFFYRIGTIVVPLLIYGFICRVNIDLDIWNFNSGIWFIGLFRVFAGLCMGVCSFRVFHFLKCLKISASCRRKIEAASVLVLLAILAYTYVFAFTYADYFLVFLLVVVLAVFNQMDVKASRIGNVLLFMGKWSVSLYCSHWLVRYLVPKLMPESTYAELLPIYLIGSLLYSLLITVAASYLTCGIKWIWRRAYDSKI